ncbi:MAG TPA: glycosyltransferase family 4 protein [Cellvibrionaceae bacterium]|nr:glycosyltransferase family 4 protein [Cellvibrionaceae bacterium]
MPATSPSILHAIDTTGPGGAETVFLDLVQYLTIPQHQNIALIKGPGWVEQQLIKRGIRYFVLKPYGFLSLPYYWQVLKLLRQQNVRLVQANLLGSTLTFSILTLLLGIPLVATLHGQVDVNPQERFIGLKNRLMKWGVNQLVCVSDDLRRYIAGRKLFALDAIKTIYNGIDPERYKNATAIDIRRQLNLPPDTRLIGAIGNIRPAKDYANLIRAAQQVLQSHNDVHFVIAGHPKKDLMNELNRLVGELNLSAHLHFVGFLDNTPGFLADIDVFVLSSISEGFSIATLEAMASGLPVVATRCGGPEEILTPEVDGVLVAKSNPAELAGALMQTLEDAQLRASLAEQAQLTVQERFSISAMLKRYSHIYTPYLQQPTTGANRDDSI